MDLRAGAGNVDGRTGTNGLDDEDREVCGKAYGRFAWLLNLLQSPLLLAIRLYWGFQFAQDGLGKLRHLDHVTQFFASLNLPAPGAAALMVALIEFGGGILFALGLGSRIVSLVLFVNMTMAYLSVPDDKVNFPHSQSRMIFMARALIRIGLRRC